MLTLVLVGDMEAYVELVKMTAERFSEDYIGNDQPLYSGGVLDIEDALELDFKDAYDEDGQPIYGDGDVDDIPYKLWERELSNRMNELDLTFPFHVVICGENGFDRMGDKIMSVFYETKASTVHGLKSPGNT